MNPRTALDVIPLERIEAEAEYVTTELERLLERAREIYRGIQDAECEVEDGAADQGRLWSTLIVARHDLAFIARQLTRAQASLVDRRDHRFGAAQKVIGYCDEADDAARAA